MTIDRGDTVLRDLFDRLTYRAADQNPTLARHDALDADFAGWSMADEFGPPPAVAFADELLGLDDLAIIRGPQRRASGHVRPPVSATARTGDGDRR